MADSEARRGTAVEPLSTDPRRQAFAEVLAWALAASEVFRRNVQPVTSETVAQLLGGLASWARGEAEGGSQGGEGTEEDLDESRPSSRSEDLLGAERILSEAYDANEARKRGTVFGFDAYASLSGLQVGALVDELRRLRGRG